MHGPGNSEATFKNVLTMTGTSPNLPDNPRYSYDTLGINCLDTLTDFIERCAMHTPAGYAHTAARGSRGKHGPLHGTGEGARHPRGGGGGHARHPRGPAIHGPARAAACLVRSAEACSS